MFGLMRPKRGCSTHSAQNSTYLLHRQHYCGTCKAIGSSFDHKSRLLLNFDTVFLAELLSELAHSSPTTWETNLQKVNTCLTMPQGEALPFSLLYAAQASVLLGGLKVDDNIQDHGGLGWRLARLIYNKPFQKAHQQLQAWGLEEKLVETLIERQVELEQSPILVSSDLLTHLEYYAAPTAEITGALFALSGQLLDNKVDLRVLGETFGQLMYVLDAFEDYERDVFKGQFNPLAVYWQQTRQLQEKQLEEVRALILNLEQQLCAQFYNLPINKDVQERFIGRLQSNLALRLYKERATPKTWRERLSVRWAQAKTTAEQFTCQPTTWARQMSFYMIAVAVFVNPEAQDYLPQEGKWEIVKWGLVFTATLATLGLLPIVRRQYKSRRERRQERRAQRQQKRFFRRLWRKLRRQPPEPENVNNCCTVCGELCCDGCCQSCIESGFCSDCCERAFEDDTCLVISIILMVLGVALVVTVLVLWAMGIL